MRVLVTGASKGIGRAVAVAFAEQGDRIAVHYVRDVEGAERTRALLPGDGHVLVAGDLGEDDVPPRVARETIDALGGIDVLVNNAGVAPSASNRHTVTDTDYLRWQQIWRRMLDVNVLGVAGLTYAVAQHFIEAGVAGRIINIGSRGVFRGEPEFPAYAASKAALHTFGQSMAVALAPHDIAVATVAPGFIGTERQEHKLSGPQGPAIRDQSPFGRVGTPEEVAAAVVYLADPRATWASGAILDLNGASHLRT